MSIRKLKFVANALAFSFTFLLSLQPSYASRVSPPVTKCFIRVDNPHLSNSIKRLKGFDAVKVNAVSTCNREIFNLQITVEIRKKGLLIDHQVAKRTLEVDGYTPPNKRIAHKGTWRKCENERVSEYYGVAYAVASIEGKRMQTLPVSTARNISLPCGT